MKCNVFLTLDKLKKNSVEGDWLAGRVSYAKMLKDFSKGLLRDSDICLHTFSRKTRDYSTGYVDKNIGEVLFPFLILLPSDHLKFICLPVWIFVWAIHHVKIHLTSQILDRLFINILRSYTKNCDRMLDTFYRATSKSFLIFVMPLLLSECSNFHDFFIAENQNL